MNKLPFYSLLARIRPAPVSAALKRVFHITRRAVTMPEGTFWIDPVSNFGLALLRDRSYEPAMTKTVTHYLRSGSLFVDLGANEGFFSVIAAKTVGPAGRVLAVEPQARLGPVLAENFRLNGVANIVIEATAISDTAGTQTMYLTPDLNTGASGLERVTKYRVPTQQVGTTTLSELFRRHGIDRADLVKMDIEGFEHEAVFGSPELFEQRRIRAFALEIHPSILRQRGHDPFALHEFLSRCGYRTDPDAANLVYLAG